MMVHDLRNPLAGIITSLDLLRRLDRAQQAVLHPKQAKFVDLANSNAEKMHDLVDGILDVNRLEAGYLELELAPVDMSQLLDQTIAGQEILAREKSALIHCDISVDTTPAWGDVKLLERVLRNLIDNALKFGPEGQELTIQAKIADAQEGGAGDRPFWQISIHDQAGGIPAEVRSRLFQKFAVGRQPEGGSGLGLAFCRLAIEAHGGEIWVDSRPRDGSTFTLTVPLVNEID
jgi:signal transduction histidine kinase